MFDAVASNQPCILQDYDASVLGSNENGEGKPFKSAMAIPLRNSEELVGILLLFAEEEGAFHPDDLLWARTFQHIAGLAFEKSRLLRVESEARMKLESLVESRSRLMRGFSHDVKNPLGAADGFAALLVNGVYGTLSTAQEEGINRIRRSIHNSLTLIDDLHDFVRAEAGHVTLRRSSTDIAGLVQTIGLQYEAAATAKKLSLRMCVPKELPSADTDGARLRQIIGNLLSNAIKYTDVGSIELRASACNTIDRGAGVLIEVTDTGPGIPSEKQDYIFEEFSRLPGSHPGAGLGLSISKLLAEALGGQISVRSAVGEGSTFSLWIPVIASDG
jgi:signal transduction histidine kinase